MSENNELFNKSISGNTSPFIGSLLYLVSRSTNCGESSSLIYVSKCLDSSLIYVSKGASACMQAHGFTN